MRWVWPLLLLTGCTQGPAIAPDRIISNNPCIDAILAEVAEPQQMGAVSRWSHESASGSAPLDWARQFPAIGDSAEEIIRAKPRLVLTGNLASSGTNAVLETAGIQPVSFGVPATVAESVDQVRIVALTIDRPAKGAALIRRIKAATSPSPPGRSAIIWQAGGFVAGRGTLQDELLSRAGYRNASALYGLNQWDVLPLEVLIKSPPDVIFMPLRAAGEEGRSVVLRQRLLRRLGTQTRIVDFPDRLLFCGGSTIVEAMAVLRGGRE